MSRSYRLPYSAITGHSSAKGDKIQAHRGVRASQKHAIRNCLDWDEFLIPHRYECSYNDVWSWHRDGKKRLREFDHNDFNPFFAVGAYCKWSMEELMEFHFESLERHRQWLLSLTRK